MECNDCWIRKAQSKAQVITTDSTRLNARVNGLYTDPKIQPFPSHSKISLLRKAKNVTTMTTSGSKKDARGSQGYLGT